MKKFFASMLLVVSLVAFALRLDTCVDGSTDLVISEQLRSQQSGLDRAVRTTSEAYDSFKAEALWSVVFFWSAH